jgi:hypothetical protein
MNQAEKEIFVKDLIANVQQSILLKVGQMPDGWDGHELRQYLADCFAAQTTAMPLARRREYRNEVAVLNL